MYRWLAIAGAVVLIPLVVVLAVFNVRDTTSTTSKPPAVLTVDGYQVSEREYRLKIDVVTSNIEYMRGVAATDAPQAAFMGAFADLISETGPDEVALAAVIADAAVYQWGVNHGLAISPDELNAALDEQRQIVTTADDPGLQAHREFIAKVGDDTFWDQILPRQLRYDLMTAKVRGRHSHWDAFQRQVARDADIESLDADLISQQMIDRAVQYLTEDYPAFQAEHPQQ